MADSTTGMSKILYRCYETRSREGEQFIQDHAFSFQVAGASTLFDGKKSYVAREGDFRLVRRNRLAKFNKQPPENGEFKSISVLLDQQTLHALSNELNLHAEKSFSSNDIAIPLKSHPLYTSFIDSLWVYLQLPEDEQARLMESKVREIVQLLLLLNPETKDILFDFSQPGKIDLEAFMEKNFHFNVSLDRFAYLTGRSLATFKRDFQKIFNTSPRHWLQQRRLREAHLLLKERRIPVSDVYIEVGFENLSHFSFAFKKEYGYAPTELLKTA